MSAAEPLALAQGVRAAVDGAEADLGRMPFFVRPMARKGFESRTGMAHEAWRARLAAFRPGDTPASARARWPSLEADLARLADDLRSSPERAARGMKDEAVLAEVRRRSAERTRAVEALLAWARG